MPRPEIPQHIWHVILRYLDTPRPAPLSAPPRSALGKPSLCNLALTCRLFRTITESILYAEIVTDSLHLLLSTVDATDPSTYHRFRHTRKLFIEYAATGHDVPYRYLEEDKNQVFWMLCGRMPEEAAKTVSYDCSLEVQELLEAMGKMNQLGMAKLFPQLVSIAVSSIYGKENDRWGDFAKIWAAGGSWPITTLASQFTTFLDSGSLKYICQRNANGPFSILSGEPPARPPRYEVSLHISPASDILYTPLGAKTRWVSEYPTSRDLSLIIQDLGQSLHHITENRKTSAEAKAYPERIIDLAIFGSAKYLSPPAVQVEGVDPDMYRTMVLPEEYQRTLALDLGEQQQERFRKAGGPRDVVEWFPASMTPICESCQSGAPGEEWGVWTTGPYAATAVADEVDNTAE